MQVKPWIDKYDQPYKVFSDSSVQCINTRFAKVVSERPGQTFIISENKSWTYSEIDQYSIRLANYMLGQGICAGDRIAISLPNSSEFVISVLACLKIGVIAVLTNPRYTEFELEYQYRDSGARLVICRNSDFEKVSAIYQRGKTAVETILVSGVSGELGSGSDSFDDALYMGAGKVREAVTPANQPVLIIYTGGTTGSSKGCCINTRNLNAVAFGWIQMCRSHTDISRYRVLSTTPMYHIHGFQTTINACIFLGGSMIILDDIGCDAILKAINAYEPNVWPAVPRQIIGLTCHSDLNTSKISKIQHIGCGSSPLPVVMMKHFEQISGVPIIEGYGATETSMAVSCNPVNYRKIGSVGIPYPNTDCKVVDLEAGTEEVPLGTVGELCFRGPQIITHYWQKPEETAKAFRDEWWYSGDIGYMDKDGFIYIVDRKKDMIICSGFKVFCSEVENVLNHHPDIAEAAIIGVADPVRTETVKAFIVMKKGKSLSGNELNSYCRQYLAPYKVPASYEFLDLLPRTSILKVDKKALRKQALLRSDAGEGVDFPFLRLQPMLAKRRICEHL